MSSDDSLLPDTAAPAVAEPLPASEPAVAEAVAEPAAPVQAPAAAASAQEMSPAACGQQLKALFPALFSGAAKPLKLRIQADIQERAPGVFTKQVLSAFLRRHTGATSYLLAVSKAATRFDLDGAPAGELSDEHRQAAVQELTRRRSTQESRRALEDEQRHNRAGLLRSFETTTLTRANFCALMGVVPEELDGLLAIAREEAQQRAQQMPAQRPGGPDHRRPDNRGAGNRGTDNRGPDTRRNEGRRPDQRRPDQRNAQPRRDSQQPAGPRPAKPPRPE